MSKLGCQEDSLDFLLSASVAKHPRFSLKTQKKLAKGEWGMQADSIGKVNQPNKLNGGKKFSSCQGKLVKYGLLLAYSGCKRNKHSQT